jgi:hypothetical protein
MAMATHAVHNHSHNPQDPIIHDLDPIRIDGHDVSIRLIVCRAGDGSWQGRMQFSEPESGAEVETAEIFCGPSEKELWESVGHLREHHLRDLFRSLEQ